jgi:hypothetical protein
MKVNYKIVRKFKDKNNTIYTIYQKPNRHYCLTELKENETGANIIEGNKNKIFAYLQEKHNDNVFTEI